MSGRSDCISDARLSHGEKRCAVECLDETDGSGSQKRRLSISVLPKIMKINVLGMFGKVEGLEDSKINQEYMPDLSGSVLSWENLSI